MQSIIIALQEYVKVTKEVPSRRKFVEETNITLSDIITHFRTWNNLITKAGFTPNQVRISWTKDACIDNLYDFVINNSRLPVASEFNTKTTFSKPPTKTIQKLFGSWNNFIQEAGFIPKEGLGTISYALDGFKYKSVNEMLFVNKVLFKKEHYEYEISYPNSSYKYDFYLKDLDIYIEIAGLLDKEDYVKRLKEKININEEFHRKLLIVLPKEILKIKDIRKYIENYDFTNRNFK